jgi:hypothetical protein
MSHPSHSLWEPDGHRFFRMSHTLNSVFIFLSPCQSSIILGIFLSFSTYFLIILLNASSGFCAGGDGGAGQGANQRHHRGGQQGLQVLHQAAGGPGPHRWPGMFCPDVVQNWGLCFGRKTILHSPTLEKLYFQTLPRFLGI